MPRAAVRVGRGAERGGPGAGAAAAHAAAARLSVGAYAFEEGQYNYTHNPTTGIMHTYNEISSICKQ